MKQCPPYSIIIAVIFLSVGIAIRKNGDYDFALTMTILPGILFPIASINLKGKSWLNVLIHFLISNVILILAFGSYMLNDRSNHLILLGAFLGSLSFQTATKYIFKTKTSWKIICIISIFSSIAFIPFQVNWSYDKLGFGIFLWMIMNAIIVNNGTTANSGFTP